MQIILNSYLIYRTYTRTSRDHPRDCFLRGARWYQNGRSPSDSCIAEPHYPNGSSDDLLERSTIELHKFSIAAETVLKMYMIYIFRVHFIQYIRIQQNSFTVLRIHGNVYRAEIHMEAIILMTRTKYACNERGDWDLICLQSLSKKGLNMFAMLLTLGT